MKNVSIDPTRLFETLRTAVNYRRKRSAVVPRDSRYSYRHNPDSFFNIILAGKDGVYNVTTATSGPG